MSTQTDLNLAVHELCRDHKRFIERDSGEREAVTELSLLAQLQEAKTMKLNGAGGGGAGGAGMPFGVGAHDIEADIIKTVHLTAPVHERYQLASMPLGKRVLAWSNLVEASLALAWVLYWSECIRDLFRSKFALDGACPECGESGVSVEIGEEVRVKAALIVTVETQTAACGACGAAWSGAGELKGLCDLL